MTSILEYRSDCPLAKTLEVIGDRWSLIIIRDLAYGAKTYGQLENSAEKITTNILANRLKRLTTFGIIEKTLYQEKPKRYTYGLTHKGKCLIPVLLELVKWGEEHIDNLCDHIPAEALSK
ncbi:hypothetical protein A9Q99_16820 [Gammaproteobacteria bacterium 45_16_T64]|nr:hypothetical protein A9Q99_16820 [Gammaproteobacteria bacterium 45_16_T64]